MRTVRIVGVVAIIAIVAAACGSSAESSATPAFQAPTSVEPESTTSTTEPFASGELVRLDLPRSDAAVSDADVAAVVRADIAFGLDLLRVTAGDGNVILSPYSIATALSMLYPGARGQTASEIAAVLHLDVDESTLHTVRNFIASSLAGPPPPPQREEDTRIPFSIEPVNSAWGQGGYPFQHDYLTVLATEYGAGLRLLDFASDPEAATVSINDWVKDATKERIADLVPDGAIDADTRLVLANAIWFKANWTYQFDSNNTTRGSFTLLDGTEVVVPLMHAEIRTGYASNDLFEAVRLPYAGDAAMVIALPREGPPAELAASLLPRDLDLEWEDSLVEVTLPMFEFEAEIALKGALQELGMRAAFEAPITGADHEADLTGITEIRELYVSDAFHKTFVTVDESGTEAAAATAIIVSRISRPRPAVLAADRPFLFWIEHATTGELLFLGQVTDPS